MSSCLLRDCDRAKYFACKVVSCVPWSSYGPRKLHSENGQIMIVLKEHYFIIPHVITEGHMIAAILKFCLMF